MGDGLNMQQLAADRRAFLASEQSRIVHEIKDPSDSWFCDVKLPVLDATDKQTGLHVVVKRCKMGCIVDPAKTKMHAVIAHGMTATGREKKRSDQ